MFPEPIAVAAPLLDSAQVHALESVMQDISSKAGPRNSIRATFKDGISTFQLPSDATLGELAGRLAHLVEGHQTRPISFEVKLGSSYY